MIENFQIRIRAPKQQFILNTLKSNSKLEELVMEIKKKSDLKEFSIKFGYPPKILDLSQINKSLFDLEIESNDTLLIEEKKSEIIDIPKDQIPDKNGLIIIRKAKILYFYF